MCVGPGNTPELTAAAAILICRLTARLAYVVFFHTYYIRQIVESLCQIFSTGALNDCNLQGRNIITFHRDLCVYCYNDKYHSVIFMLYSLDVISAVLDDVPPALFISFTLKYYENDKPTGFPIDSVAFTLNFNNHGIRIMYYTLYDTAR